MASGDKNCHRTTALVCTKSDAVAFPRMNCSEALSVSTGPGIKGVGLYLALDLIMTSPTQNPEARSFLPDSPALGMALSAGG